MYRETRTVNPWRKQEQPKTDEAIINVSVDLESSAPNYGIVCINNYYYEIKILLALAIQCLLREPGEWISGNALTARACPGDVINWSREFNGLPGPIQKLIERRRGFGYRVRRSCRCICEDHDCH